MTSLYNRVFKFIVIGSIGAVINLLAFYLLVQCAAMRTVLLKNVANILSIEIGIWFSFAMNRNWTWNDRTLLKRRKLLKQFVFFHLAVGLSVIVRIVLFPILQYLGLNYLINSALGIAFGSVINYFSFDRMIFHKSTKQEVQI